MYHILIVAPPSQDAFLSVHPIVERTLHGGQASRIVVHRQMQRRQTVFWFPSHPHPPIFLPFVPVQAMLFLYFCYGWLVCRGVGRARPTPCSIFSLPHHLSCCPALAPLTVATAQSDSVRTECPANAVIIQSLKSSHRRSLVPAAGNHELFSFPLKRHAFLLSTSNNVFPDTEPEGPLPWWNSEMH